VPGYDEFTYEPAPHQLEPSGHLEVTQ